MLGVRLAFYALASIIAAGGANAGPAVNQFEVKGLSATPGNIEFQSQNAYAIGDPKRQIADDNGTTVYDDNTVVRQRHALELEWTLSTRFRTRVGIEFEKERVDDPSSPAGAEQYQSLKLTEVAGEAVVILIPPGERGVGLGFLAEVGKPVDRSETSEFFFGPIIQAIDGPWSITANLMLAKMFGGRPDEEGAQPDDKTDFAYAVQGAYVYSDAWTLTVEAYGTVDRIGSTGRRTQEAAIFGDMDQHRIGPVVYYNFKAPALAFGGGSDDVPEASLGIGAFAGLNDHTPDATLKLSLEVEF